MSGRQFHFLQAVRSYRSFRNYVNHGNSIALRRHQLVPRSHQKRRDGITDTVPFWR
jgi:hypothetical protein